MSTMSLSSTLRAALVAIWTVSLCVSGLRNWKCIRGGCVKEDTISSNEFTSIEECKAQCLPYGGLWPKPTGPFRLGNHTSQIDPFMVNFEKKEYPKHLEALLSKAQKRFLAQINYPGNIVNFSSVNFFYKVKIRMEISDPSIRAFSTGTDESYKLRVFPPENSGEVGVTIEAKNFFGLRHGLETLSQLFFYDSVHEVYKMMDDVFIDDEPKFTHRGIVLDTARSYVNVDNILKILDAMAINKLNTFHWHITDSQSFPYESAAFPEISDNGAYSKNQVYTQKDIDRIVKEGQSLGIRIVPELDAPAHVGEGWSALGSDLITCFKWQPWRNYCVEPPCGQFDPTNERLYEILAILFKELVALFQSDLFHMGGDEVNINCWRSTPSIKTWMQKMNYSETNDDYHRLWGEYQKKALEKLKKAKSDPYPQAVLWTSTLTQPELADRYLSPEDYIIQIWTTKSDPVIKSLIEKKFRLIFSNYDELYFDCGGPSWVGNQGQNWCSPYIGWQSVYHHSPYEILENQGLQVTEEIKKLVLGSESALWTEQINDDSVHVRLWPRAAALAERLWSNPENDWTAAQFRMNHHTERIRRRVPTELLQPEWCYQNDGHCD